MSKTKKLDSLLELQKNRETQLTIDGRKIQEVLQLRKKALADLMREKADLVTRIEYYQGTVQQEGLDTGDVTLLKGVGEQQKRLQQDLQKLEKNIAEKEEELRRAEKYDQTNREALLDTRREKQKIAVVIENVRDIALADGLARDEVDLEDLNNSSRKK